MIYLLPNWEENLLDMNKQQKARHTRDNADDILRITALKRSVNARIKEIHRLISTGQAEIVDTLPSGCAK